MFQSETDFQSNAPLSESPRQFLSPSQSSSAAAIEGGSTRTATIADITDFQNKIIMIVITGFVAELTI